MKRWMVGIFSVLIVAACVPATQEGYWREGMTYQQRQSDFTDCEVEALRKVPRETAVRSTPGYVTPVQVSPISTQCFGTGAYRTCTTTGGTVSGGQVIGGGVQSYDPNTALRDQVTEQCLIRKRYELLSFPTCTSEQAKRAISARSIRLPAKEGVICVTADRSGFVFSQ
jgi:hypothetical protein